MSAEIIQFPIEAARDWVEMEKLIRGILAKSSADVALDDAVIARMKVVFEAIPTRFELQISPTELAIAQRLAPHEFAKTISGWLQRATHDRELLVFQQVLRLCLELAQAEALARTRQD